jgi:hypothetical protein
MRCWCRVFLHVRQQIAFLAASSNLYICTRMLRWLSTHMQTLSLGNCGLRVFPQSLTALTNLVWCDLSHNYAMVRRPPTLLWKA